MTDEKTDLACTVAETGRFAIKAVAETLGVSRSNLHDRLNGSAKLRPSYHKAQDAAVLSRIERLVAKRPTCRDRRITAVLKRRAQGLGARAGQPQACLPYPEEQQPAAGALWL